MIDPRRRPTVDLDWRKDIDVPTTEFLSATEMESAPIRRSRRLRLDERPTAARRSSPEGPTPPRQQAKKGRRRHIDPTTCERDYSNDEVVFMRAMDQYKRKSGRMFPTWSEVLEVLHCLGYRRVEEPRELPTYKKR